MPNWCVFLLAAGLVVLAWIGCFVIGSLLLWLAHLHTCHPSGDNPGCGPLGDLAQVLMLFGAFGAPLFLLTFIGCLIAAFIMFLASRP